MCGNSHEALSAAKRGPTRTRFPLSTVRDGYPGEARARTQIDWNFRTERGKRERGKARVSTAGCMSCFLLQSRPGLPRFASLKETHRDVLPGSCSTVLPRSRTCQAKNACGTENWGMVAFSSPLETNVPNAWLVSKHCDKTDAPLHVLIRRTRAISKKPPERPTLTTDIVLHMSSVIC